MCVVTDYYGSVSSPHPISLSLPPSLPALPAVPQWMYILIGLVLFSLMSAGQNAAQQAGGGAS